MFNFYLSVKSGKDGRQMARQKKTMPNSGGRKNDAHTYCNSMITRIENQLMSARLRATLCIALALAGLLCRTTAQETPAPPGPGTIDVEIIYDNTTGGTDEVSRFWSNVSDTDVPFTSPLASTGAVSV